eukprot:7390042-Prymnesium_polylepis.1
MPPCSVAPAEGVRERGSETVRHSGHSEAVGVGIEAVGSSGHRGSEAVGSEAVRQWGSEAVVGSGQWTVLESGRDRG